MMLIQLETAKARLKIETVDTTDDESLEAVITAVSAAFENHCKRKFARDAAAVEEFNGDDTEIRVSCYPIEEVTTWELKSNEASGWEEQSDVDFLIRRDCVISLSAPLGTYRQQGRVTYAGGYVLPGNVVDAGQTELPADIVQACTEEVARWYFNKTRPGLSGVSGQGGSIQQEGQSVVAPFPFMRETLATLKNYERWVN